MLANIFLIANLIGLHCAHWYTLKLLYTDLTEVKMTYRITYLRVDLCMTTLICVH